MAEMLHKYPELALFLAIVLGHLIGRWHYKGVGFGAVVGTLIAGIVIGIVGKPELPELLRWTFFYLFLFAIGYSVGPQFFGSLKRQALPQIGLAVAVAFTGLATVVVLALVFGFDEGIAVGLLSGGMTQSAALGTGLNAIADLPLPADVKATLAAHAPLADAITYGFGDLGLILFLTWLGPKLMRADLKQEAKLLEEQLGGGKGAHVAKGTHFAYRAHEITKQEAAVTVEALEDRYADERLFVQRVRRGGELLQVAPHLHLARGDLVVVGARLGALARLEKEVGPERDEPELLAIPLKTVAVVVTSKATHGCTLDELATRREMARGVHLESLQRGEEVMPLEPWTTVERGDLVKLTGAPVDVDRVAAEIGFVERDVAKTDLAFLAAGVCVGIVLGMFKVKLGDVAFGLGTSGAILVTGLLAGWARSRNPVFGSIPVPAQRLLMDIGLIVFIAVVGLHAGPHALEAYHKSGGAFFVRILLAGVVVTMTPLLVGLVVARWVLRMNPMMVVGGLAGAQTCTPGLNALREASGSNVGAIAYTVPYALNNILLTLWGPVVVGIVYAMRS